MLDGRPLVVHAIERFAPQVATLAISANRNLDAYAGFGVLVRPDDDATFAGPLAGLATAFAHLTTDWLATVPCDSPVLPTDLVARLGAAVNAAGDACRAAVPCTIEGRKLRRHGVCALVHRSLGPALVAYLASGERRVEQWLLAQAVIDVVFDDGAAFANVNTPDELRAIEVRSG
jgi:molybdopterin-guanine dinucleotide biosynthesis protein A